MAEVCALCERSIEGKVATRLAQGPICPRCYARDFCHVQCATCGRATRSVHGKTPALCAHCRPKAGCAQCGAPVNRRSKTNDLGEVICSTCSEKASAPKQCSKCGLVSRHLLAGKDNAGQPICKDCLHPGAYANCCECGKHRLIKGHREDGRALCGKCSEGPPFICPECSQPGRRHSEARCFKCYLRKRAMDAVPDISSTLDGSSEYKALFERFAGDWIGEHEPSPTHPHYLEGHAEFFLALSKVAASPREITQSGLFAAFTPHQLQNAFAPVSWLIAQGYLVFLTAEAMAEETQRLAQKSILERSPEGWKRELLTRFHAALDKHRAAWQKHGWTGKHERYKARTATLALRAACRLLESAAEYVAGPQSIDQPTLEKFVAEHPGHRNSVRKFVAYLNAKEHVFTRLKVPACPRTFPQHQVLAPDRAAELMQGWADVPETQVRDALLCRLMFIYARTATQACSMRRGRFTVGQDGKVNATFGAVPIRLDAETAALLRAHLSKLELASGKALLVEDLLFPGRMAGQALKPASLRYITRKAGVTAPELYSTALAETYRSGLEFPKVLVRSLGITDFTALKYSEVFSPRLSQEIAQRAGRR